MNRATYEDVKKWRWAAYMMPSVKGRSFLDVGCWAGGFVRFAADLGASFAQGIDAVYNDLWPQYIMHDPAVISFQILDVFSDTLFRKVAPHDVVLCSGVLYHVSDPVGLFTRLRYLTVRTCILETAIREGYPAGDSKPTLTYLPNDSFDKNPSNWFLPNQPFIYAIAKEVGFKITDAFKVTEGRWCYHMDAVPMPISEKSLPRRKEFMRN